MATALDHLALGGRIDWLASLDTAFQPAQNYRRTSIICTIGPKSNSVEVLNKLRNAGLNVVRMNFSHGEYEYHQSVIDNARAAEKSQPGRQVAIALDTKGPEIRTGNTTGDADLPISAGTEMNITTDDKYKTACDTENMYVDYKNITKVIQKGRTIYVDDGILAFEVLDIVDDKTLRVRCKNNGFISSRKGVNLPNTDVDLPALSEKDKNDLRFGVKNNVDMVFASFIRRGEDIKSIREVLGEQGKHIQIIAKIENRQGLNNFAEILQETDGVMVARGDLGIEIPAAEVFAAQKKMIAMCNIAGKPVTEMSVMHDEKQVGGPGPGHDGGNSDIDPEATAVPPAAPSIVASGRTAKHPKLRLLKSRRLLAANFGIIIQAGAMISWDTVGPLFVKDTFDWSSTAAGLIFFAIFIPAFISPVVGWMCDRYGARWPTTAGFAASIPVLVCLRFVTDNTIGHKVLLGALLALLGVTLTFANTPLMAEITYAIDAEEAASPGVFGRNGVYGLGYGLFCTSFALGGSVGSLMSGYVMDRNGWGTLTWVLAVWMASGAVVVALGVGGGKTAAAKGSPEAAAGADIESSAGSRDPVRT